MKFTFRAVTLAFFCVCTAGTIRAATLFDLIDQNGSLTIGDKVFDNFGWTSSVDDHNIIITTVGNGSANNLFGIDINLGGNFTLSGPGNIDGVLTYRLQTIGNQLISDVHQAMTASGSDPGFWMASINEEVSPNMNDIPVVADSVVYLNSLGATHLTDAADLLTPLGTVWINKDINVFSEFGSVQITDVQQRFSQVPDVGSTLTMLVLALAGVGGLRWIHRE